MGSRKRYLLMVFFLFFKNSFSQGVRGFVSIYSRKAISTKTVKLNSRRDRKGCICFRRSLSSLMLVATASFLTLAIGAKLLKYYNSIGYETTIYNGLPTLQDYASF